MILVISISPNVVLGVGLHALYEVEGTFNSCLDRQVREGVLITYGEADEIMNSKTEYHQPGVTRVVPTREVGR